ncbi:Protein tesmin/TSO1-like CXC 4 [Porphyridium purpureum]|uniref:Protein tesmin/TSO1-like CXC 4 n=1 Tax=Porphyridium purpureum TaxID=35688 RepID=A0A5J4Z9I1_PORPP|nr:Protein tesmin/TSO1-like CXC 4 [Porphyridium purpureum]|eukprot:POR6938..scf295_1
MDGVDVGLGSPFVVEGFESPERNALVRADVSSPMEFHANDPLAAFETPLRAPRRQRGAETARRTHRLQEADFDTPNTRQRQRVEASRRTGALGERPPEQAEMETPQRCVRQRVGGPTSASSAAETPDRYTLRQRTPASRSVKTENTNLHGSALVTPQNEVRQCSWDAAVESDDGWPCAIGRDIGQQRRGGAQARPSGPTGVFDVKAHQPPEGPPDHDLDYLRTPGPSTAHESVALDEFLNYSGTLTPLNHAQTSGNSRFIQGLPSPYSVGQGGDSHLPASWLATPAGVAGQAAVAHFLTPGNILTGHTPMRSPSDALFGYETPANVFKGVRTGFPVLHYGSPAAGDIGSSPKNGVLPASASPDKGYCEEFLESLVTGQTRKAVPMLGSALTGQRGSLKRNLDISLILTPLTDPKHKASWDSKMSMYDRLQQLLKKKGRAEVPKFSLPDEYHYDCAGNELFFEKAHDEEHVFADAQTVARDPKDKVVGTRSGDRSTRGKKKKSRAPASVQPKVVRHKAAALRLPAAGAQDAANKEKGCKCKSSTECLKLYCVCFAAGGVCGEHCGCTGCANREEFRERVDEAREAAMLRNPLCFGPKVVPVAEGADGADATALMGTHVSGFAKQLQQQLEPVIVRTKQALGSPADDAKNSIIC